MIIYFLEKKCKEAINLKKQYLIIGILCFLIAMGISIQIKTVKSWNTSTSMQSTAENKLKDSIFKAKEKYENTYQELQDTLKQLEEVRSTVANSSSEAGKIEAQISEINKLLGYTEVKGKGIEIEVKDGTPEKMEGYEYNDEYVNYLSNYMVHDGDLKEIVNELFNAGAEAISINGERIVSTSSISCSGNIIKVNNEKLYLSPIVDLFNGEVISFNLSRHPVFAQVVDMLEKAFNKIPDNTNLILHSDQEWQYQ